MYNIIEFIIIYCEYFFSHEQTEIAIKEQLIKFAGSNIDRKLFIHLHCHDEHY